VLNRLLAHRVALALSGGACLTVSSTTKLDDDTLFWHHDKKDFDVYITNPSPEDLPNLLKQFQAGKEVWPWIWCQPNENGIMYMWGN